MNPEHLFLGTQLDNIRDMYRKGRAVVGERMNNAKLSRDKVAQFPALRAAGWSWAKIGRLFGVSEMTASKAGRGVTWKRSHK